MQDQNPNPHRWRRRVAVLAAGAATVSMGLVALPDVLPAGATTSLNQVTQDATGTAPAVGAPQTKADAAIAVKASAVAPNGDVAEMSNADQVFLVVNSATESATDFGLGATGDLTQNDVYLIAGTGVSGWPTSFAGGNKATSTKMDASHIDFDSNGNLLIAGQGSGKSLLMVVAATTGTFYGISMTAGDEYYVAGYISATSTLLAPAIAYPTPFNVVALAASSGLKTGTTQNVVIGTNTDTTTPTNSNVYYLNYGTTAETLYGASGGEAADSLKEIAGGGTTACAPGSQSAADTGTSGFAAAPDSIYVGSTATIYLGNASTCVWAIPAAAGSLTLNGTSTTVVAGTAYKVAGDGTPVATTAPTNGATATHTPVGDVLSITADKAGNLVLTLGTGGASYAGVYVVAASAGTYYGVTMTAGRVYEVVGATPANGGVTHAFATPILAAADPSNLFVADTTSHVLFSITGAPTGKATPAEAVTVTLTVTPVSGASVTLTAKVSATTGTPVGNVTFFVNSTSTALNHTADPTGVPTTTVTGPPSYGQATLTVTLPTGSDSLRAHFTPTTAHVFKAGTGTAHTTIATSSTYPAGNTIHSPTAQQFTITVTVTATGIFQLTFRGTTKTVHLSKPKWLTKSTHNTLSSTGTIGTWYLKTTVNTVPGWTVTGLVGTFVNSTNPSYKIPAKDLGWTPNATNLTGTTVTPGAAIPPGQSSPSLASTATWASATVTHGHGTTKLGAALHLVFPERTHPGTYNAPFTVTAIQK